MADAIGSLQAAVLPEPSLQHAFIDLDTDDVHACLAEKIQQFAVVAADLYNGCAVLQHRHVRLSVVRGNPVVL